jgi:hypothetical protein
MLGQNKGANSSQKNKGKTSYHYMSTNIIRSIAQQRVGPGSVRFLSMWTRKTLVYSPSTNNEETLHQHISVLAKPVAANPEPLQTYRSPRSEVSMRVLIQVEGILTLVVNCDLINNKN